MEILEKQDLLDFEARIFKYLELITGNPMKYWFTIEDLAELRNCSASELHKNQLLQPNHGVPDDRWGRARAWSRATVENWLRKTRKELEAMASVLTPRDIERYELLRKSESDQKRGNVA